MLFYASSFDCGVCWLGGQIAAAMLMNYDVSAPLTVLWSASWVCDQYFDKDVRQVNANEPPRLSFLLPQGATCRQRGDEHLCWWRVSFLDRHALDASVIHCLVEACFACRAKGTCEDSKIQLMRVSESACVAWISLDAQLRLLFLNLHTECWMDLMLAVTAELGGFEVCHAGSRKHRQHDITWFRSCA